MMLIEKRNTLIIKLIDKGMSYRNIGKLFGLSHTMIKDINKKFKDRKKPTSKCLLCSKEGKTICDDCLEKINQYKIKN